MCDYYTWHKGVWERGSGAEHGRERVSSPGAAMSGESPTWGKVGARDGSGVSGVPFEMRVFFSFVRR